MTVVRRLDAIPADALSRLRELAERLERGDDGDPDSPTWDNEDRVRILRAEVGRYLTRVEVRRGGRTPGA